jgi:membrane-associated protein
MFGIDLIQLVSTAGYFGIAAIIFAESGLFIGAILPGDSLLFTTGLLSSRGLFDIRLMIPLLMAAAVIGDSVGFSIGRKLGPRLFAKEDTRIFKKKYLIDAQKFFDKHGGKAIILARFIPAVRSFTPMIAGAANMNYGNFIKFNIFDLSDTDNNRIVPKNTFFLLVKSRCVQILFLNLYLTSAIFSIFFTISKSDI